MSLPNFPKAPLLLPLIALLSSCSVSSPRAQTPAPQTPPVPQQIKPTPAIPTPTAVIPTPPTLTKITPPPAPTPTLNKHPLQVRKATFNGTTFTAVTFDRRDYILKIIDQKSGPGSEFKTAQEAGKDSLAVINGGFFSPDGKPIGLVITNGEARGIFNSSSFLGTGILDGKNLTLASRKNYKKSPELLQTGPRLLWPGQTLTGLSSKNPRTRSLLIWDGQHHFGIVHASFATLQGLSNNLKSQPLTGFKITHALNLDGGTSSDLWISNTITGGGISKRSFLNKPVRNYLALQKR